MFHIKIDTEYRQITDFMVNAQKIPEQLKRYLRIRKDLGKLIFKTSVKKVSRLFQTIAGEP